MKSFFKNNIVCFVCILILALIIAVVLCFYYDVPTKVIETMSKKELTENNINNIIVNETTSATNEIINEQQKINAKELIRVKSITTSEPNIAGGVDLDIKWTNMSDKVIKYITFTAYPINAVGDIVKCTIRTQNEGQFKGQQTGPISKGEGNKEGYIYANAWYNNTIVKAILMQIDIEYMDGSTVCLMGENLDEVIY